MFPNKMEIQNQIGIISLFLLVLLPFVYFIPEPLTRYMVSLSIVLVSSFLTYTFPLKRSQDNVDKTQKRSQQKSIRPLLSSHVKVIGRKHLNRNIFVKLLLKICQIIILTTLVIMSSSNIFSFENQSKTIITYRILWWISVTYLSVNINTLVLNKFQRTYSKTFRSLIGSSVPPSVLKDRKLLFRTI